VLMIWTPRITVHMTVVELWEFGISRELDVGGAGERRCCYDIALTCFS
jgi:hypothetical protein